MKLNKLIKKTLGIALAAIAITFSGCDQQNNVIAPDSSAQNERPTAVAADGKTIHFIGFNENHQRSLNKVTTVEKMITKKRGGMLELSTVDAYFSLEVPSKSIDDDKIVSMTYDDQNFQGFTDIVFGPHGTQFSKPALLNVSLQNMDLTGMDPNKVGLYYVNDNGQWEKMVVESITVEPVTGTVIVLNAQIPHFSRYAVASE
jgi:hypothetical protein